MRAWYLSFAGTSVQGAAEVPVRPIDQPSAWYLGQPWLAGLVRHPLSGLRIELLCRARAAP